MGQRKPASVSVGPEPVTFKAKSVTFKIVGTRTLIAMALVTGMIILVAFAVQVLIAL